MPVAMNTTKPFKPLSNLAIDDSL